MPNKSSIPHYYLYGEQAPTDELEFIHIEKIADRSSQYGWEIEPHRHDNLMQLMVVQEGEIQTSIDTTLNTCTTPSVVSIPPTRVHDFIVAPDTEGYVLSISEVFLQSIFSESERLALTALLEQPHVISLGAGTRRLNKVNNLISAIADEYQNAMPGRFSIIGGYLKVLLTLLARYNQASTDSRQVACPQQNVFNRFKELVEENYKAHLNISQYAERLNVTESRLNSACRSQVDQSPVQLQHSRLLLEAKRYLVYSIMSVTEISYEIGFNDPAHFSKFFCKGTGVSPKHFREKYI